MNAKDYVTTFSGLITEGMKLAGQWVSGSKFRFHAKMAKKMRKAVEAGERYILTNEDPDLDEKLKVKYLEKYKEMFFKNNN